MQSRVRRKRKKLTEEYLKKLKNSGMSQRQLEIESGWSIDTLYKRWREIGCGGCADEQESTSSGK